MAIPFFVNPPRRRRRRKKKGVTARRARRRARRVAARRRPRRRRVGGVVRSIRDRRTGKPVSRSAWLASPFRRNPMARRRRRRRYRRNPLVGRGMMGAAINTLIGGAGVTVGKVVARQAAGMLRLDPNSPVGIAGQLAVAVLAGTVARRTLRLRGPFADGLIYGAASGAAESALKLIAPGAVGRLLGEDYEVPLGAYELSAYPTGAALAASTAREQAALLGAYAGTGLM